MGGKKKSKKADGEEKPKEKAEEPEKKELPSMRENWINIEFKLLNWKFMNFSMKFRENTHIFSIKKILQQRHGRMDELKICLHSYTESNEIADEMMTLLQCGLKGQPIPAEYWGDDAKAVEDKVIPTVQIFYDFKPTNFSDPVLLFFK